MTGSDAPRHLRVTAPPPWFVRFAALVPSEGEILDVACGGGRHGRLFLARGQRVTFVDRDIAAVADLAAAPLARLVAADLEVGKPPPFTGRSFAGVIVSNYLHRPLFPALIDALAPGGVLIYETFARGNEEFCRPRHPDHLLRSGELLEVVRGRLQVVAYEHGRVVRNPIPGVVQRLCAINDLGRSTRSDGEPPAHSLDL
jgi:SAM-dependent methyltransferase